MSVYAKFSILVVILAILLLGCISQEQIQQLIQGGNQTQACIQPNQLCGYGAVSPTTTQNQSTFYGECCSGYACISGYCKNSSGACAGTGQFCKYGPANLVHPDNLTYYGECCAGECTNGYCKIKVQCKTSGSCSSNSDCCSGSECRNGICAPPCRTSGACSSNSECCSSYYCNQSMQCAKPCVTSGNCSVNSDCCSGLACVNGICGTPPKLCSQITPQTESDCDAGTCPAGTCRYLPAKHLNNDPGQPITQNAMCWCDSCVQTPTNADSIWVNGSCSNGTATYTDYCDREGGEILHNSRCFNYTAYTGADTHGYPLGSCSAYTVNCSQFNAKCYNGSCVNITCQTSGLCSGDSNCCPAYYCNPNGYCALRPNCTYEYGSCTTSSQCCHGYVCRYGECLPACSPGKYCTSNLDCCPGYQCSGGACTLTCKVFGYCAQNSDCCQGYSCTDNNCTVACNDSGFSCSNSAQCCEGNNCNYYNTCVNESCAVSGDSCNNNILCCSPYACVNGICGTPQTCRNWGNCNGDVDCCNGFYCNSKSQCAVCLTVGTCTKNTQCCSGYCGSNGYCTSQSCETPGVKCSSTSDCCYGLSCYTAICSACKTSGYCVLTSDCCKGYYCSDGSCVSG